MAQKEEKTQKSELQPVILKQLTVSVFSNVKQKMGT